MFQKLSLKLSKKTIKHITAVFVVLIVADVGVYFLAGSNAAPSCTSGASCPITASQGASRSLSPDFLGFNGDSSSAAWANPAVLPAVKQMDPETIRGIWGGTPSNYFNWQTGSFFIASADPDTSYLKPGYPTPPYTLSNYVNALKAGNADGVFNINVMTYCPVSNTDPTSTSEAGVSCTDAQACGPNPSAYTTTCTNTDYTWGLDYQIALLKAAQSMGVPIKYIELGNEDYISSDPDYAYYFPTVQAYINKVNAWIPILKEDFPGAQIAVVGDGSCQPPTSAAQAWNQAIASGVKGEDAITFHTYYGNTIPSGSSVSNAADLAKQLSISTQNCNAVLQETLNNPQYLPSGVSAWITEWNLWSGGTGTVLGSWAQGLMAANYALDLARQPQIELTDNHDLFSNQIYGSIFASTSYDTKAEGGKAIGVPSPTPTTQLFGMTANGFALSALERSLHGATNTAAIDLSSVPDIATTSVPGLFGQSFTVNGKPNLYFVNLSADSETIELGSLSGSYSVLQYASSPTNFVTGDSSIAANVFNATNTLFVPAYSVTSLVGGQSSPSPTPSPINKVLTNTNAPNAVSTKAYANGKFLAAGQGNRVIVNSSTLPNGSKKITLVSVNPNGRLTIEGVTIQVHNPWLRAFINYYRAHPLAVILEITIPIGILILAFILGFSYIKIVIENIWSVAKGKITKPPTPTSAPPTIIYPST